MPHELAQERSQSLETRADGTDTLLGKILDVADQQVIRLLPRADNTELPSATDPDRELTRFGLIEVYDAGDGTDLVDFRLSHPGTIGVGAPADEHDTKTRVFPHAPTDQVQVPRFEDPERHVATGNEHLTQGKQRQFAGRRFRHVRTLTRRLARTSHQNASRSVDLSQVIVLALIQGITEFLPISSSAHLILPAELTAWPDQGLLFDVAVHLGTLTAVVVYFRGELMRFAAEASRLRAGASTRLLSRVAIATVPAALAGLLFKPFIESELRTVSVIAVTTIAFAIPLWWADRRTTSTRDEHALSYMQATVIGLAQALALVPGVSRSGITITAALLVGLGREGAARFSFLLAIPTITGAALLSGIDAWTAPEVVPWTDLGLGFTVSAVAAYGCISVFVSLVNRTGMTPYVVYRLALGAVLLGFIV